MKHYETISHHFEITGATSNSCKFKYFHSWDFIQFKMKVKKILQAFFFFVD